MLDQERRLESLAVPPRFAERRQRPAEVAISVGFGHDVPRSREKGQVGMSRGPRGHRQIDLMSDCGRCVGWTVQSDVACSGFEVPLVSGEPKEREGSGYLTCR